MAWFWGLWREADEVRAQETYPDVRAWVERNLREIEDDEAVVDVLWEMLDSHMIWQAVSQKVCAEAGVPVLVQVPRVIRELRAEIERKP